MGVDKIASSLLSDARKEAEEILKAAEWHVAQMIKEEKAKRSVLLKAAEDEVAKMLKEKERERIAWAHLEAKRMIYEAREDAIKSAIEEFFSLLKDLRKHEGYAAFMKRCLARGLAEIGEKDIIVHVSKGDKKYLSSFRGKIVEDLNSLGGLIVESSDRKVRVDMTVEAMFEMERDNFRKRISDELFGAGGRERKVRKRKGSKKSRGDLETEEKPIKPKKGDD